MIEDDKTKLSFPFGSNVPRLMFPLHSPPTKLGLEQKIRGQPHCGPGSYDPKVSVTKPHSLKGWYFGCRTGKARSSLETNSYVPGPPHYQRVDFLKHQKYGYKSFGSVSSRFPSNQYHTEAPGPGQYEHLEEQNRKIKFHHSFGGVPKLKDIVKIKCTHGIAEKCSICQVIQIGDYYEHKSNQITLCPKCYNESKILKAKFADCDYRKVRDCKAIHQHQFPGFAPKMILKSANEQKRLQFKEAYLRLYYSD